MAARGLYGVNAGRGSGSEKGVAVAKVEISINKCVFCASYVGTYVERGGVRSMLTRTKIRIRGVRHISCNVCKRLANRLDATLDLDTMRPWIVEARKIAGYRKVPKRRRS